MLSDLVFFWHRMTALHRGKAAAELSEAAEHGALPRGRDLKTVLKVLLEAGHTRWFDVVW